MTQRVGADIHIKYDVFVDLGQSYTHECKFKNQGPDPSTTSIKKI